MKKKDEKQGKNFGSLKIMSTFAIPKRNNGVIAQLVEQRTENPCVPGSIPGDTTKITKSESKKSCSNATLFFHLASMLWQAYGAIVPVFVGKQTIKILPASTRFCMIVIEIIALSPYQLPFCGIWILLGHRSKIA